MNFEEARRNMVAQQIRPWDVLDQRVLDQISRIPRENYVPATYRKLAYADIDIPLGEGQVMMAPRVEARLLQALGLDQEDHVLEVGTGSGYLTALLAGLARHVVSVEISPALAHRARETLADQGIGNVTLELGDAVHGWEQAGPYDAIAVTGSVPVLSECWRQQLKRGGRLFIIVGQEPAMEARLLIRVGEQEWTSETLFETVIPPLQGAREPTRFVL